MPYIKEIIWCKIQYTFQEIEDFYFIIILNRVQSFASLKIFNIEIINYTKNNSNNLWNIKRYVNAYRKILVYCSEKWLLNLFSFF